MKTPYKNNKLIADFMCIKTFDKSNGISGLWCCGSYSDEFVKYDCSWDWLMPVVDKIESLNETETSKEIVDINSHNVRTWPTEKKNEIIAGCYRNSPEEVKFNSKIEACYYVVVKFIKWYNKQDKV